MNIPKHWQLVKLGDLCLSSQYGYTTSAAERGNIRLVRTTDIAGKSQVDWLNVPFAQTKPDNLDDFLLENGDILISRSGTVGVSSLISDIPYKAIFASYLIRFKPVIVDSEYLYYFTKTENYWQQINDYKSGNTISNVNATKLSNLDIPIPPLAEQNRIVEVLKIKLNEYQKDFETAKNELAKMAEYRKSILEEAMTGKLTEEWRKKNNVSLANWIMKQLSEISEVVLGKKLDKAKNKGNLVRYLRNINVRWFDFDLTSLKEIRISGEEQEKFSLKLGDVLICEGGEPGRSAIWKNQISGMVFQNALHRVRPDINVILPEWLIYNLKLHNDRGSLEKSFIGSAIKHLTLINLKKYSLSLPSILEQKEIITQLESSLRKIEDVEKKYLSTIELSEKLQQSVLQMAFKGQLSKVEPNDEPVLVLLERIKTEKEKMKKEHQDIKKSKSLGKMNKKKEEQKSISEVLKTADNKTLTVEELWEEVDFSKTNEVEPYYEELLDLKNTGKIDISFADEKKIKTNITLIENAY